MVTLLTDHRYFFPAPCIYIRHIYNNVTLFLSLLLSFWSVCRVCRYMYVHVHLLVCHLSQLPRQAFFPPPRLSWWREFAHLRATRPAAVDRWWNFTAFLWCTRHTHILVVVPSQISCTWRYHPQCIVEHTSVTMCYTLACSMKLNASCYIQSH